MYNEVKKTKENLSALECLLDAENVDDVKKRIANLIVERVRRDINDYDYYLFYPEDYSDTIDEAFKKVEKKIKKMYTDAMLEVATESVERFKDISFAALEDTSGIQLRNCHKCEHKEHNRCKFYESWKYYWKAHDEICAKEGFINYIEKVGK